MIVCVCVCVCARAYFCLSYPACKPHFFLRCFIFSSAACLVLPNSSTLSHKRQDFREKTFIHSVFCLTTGPEPPAKRFLHLVRSRASFFKWEYPLLSLRSSSSFLRLLPRLFVTSICPFIFPSITCYRRQFLRKMWPTQLAFRFLISCRIFLSSLTVSNTSSFLTWSIQLYLHMFSLYAIIAWSGQLYISVFFHSFSQRCFWHTEFVYMLCAHVNTVICIFRLIMY